METDDLEETTGEDQQEIDQQTKFHWIAPRQIRATPGLIWQVGKCVLQILTRGRFWDDEDNVLNPIDNDEKFGVYKQTVLQRKYSKNLMKCVLSCLSSKTFNRPTRSQLLEHFETVFSVYNGTFVKEVINDDDELPYTGPYDGLLDRIPRGLTNGEARVYETLLRVVDKRSHDNITNRDKVQRTPYIFVITDLAKDYDDLMALMVLKELERLGVVQLPGFIANLDPPYNRARFGRGALDSLGLPQIPIAVGSKGAPDKKVLLEHEFENTDDFMKKEDTERMGAEYPQGPDLMRQVLEEAAKPGKSKITLLTISSLMDAGNFVKDPAGSDLAKNAIHNIVLQGGYRIIDGVLTADPAAANNGFDIEGAQTFHTWIQDNQKPSTCYTKVAANAITLYASLFEFLDSTGHALGHYLREVQKRQDLSFYKQSCSNHPYLPHMTKEWFVETKSTWFAAGHECDEDAPEDERMLPYFTKVVAYDALAAVGASGADVLEAFQIPKPLIKRPDMDDPLHRLVGVPALCAAPGQDELPPEVNFDGDAMGLVITALMKGSILHLDPHLREYYRVGARKAREEAQKSAEAAAAAAA